MYWTKTLPSQIGECYWWRNKINHKSKSCGSLEDIYEDGVLIGERFFDADVYEFSSCPVPEPGEENPSEEISDRREAMLKAGWVYAEEGRPGVYVPGPELQDWLGNRWAVTDQSIVNLFGSMVNASTDQDLIEWFKRAFPNLESEAGP